MCLLLEVREGKRGANGRESVAGCFWETVDVSESFDIAEIGLDGCECICRH